MKTRKTKLNTKQVMCYTTHIGMYYKWVCRIQVRILGIWWTIAAVIDEDEQYCKDRANEINEYLNAE